MTRNFQLLLIAMLSATATGCTDRDTQNRPIGAAEEAQLAAKAQAGDAKAARRLEQIQKMRAAMPPHDTEYSPDILSGWQWSDEEVTALTRRAEAGNMEAADRLLQYYSVHENRAKMDYWEDWLFKRGDLRAIRQRAQRLYSASEKRSSSDPRKLAELKEAERLERSVSVNGDKNLFLERIRSEIVAIEKSQ